MDLLILTQSSGGLSIVTLFMDADWVVKAVIIGLVLASIWSWTIIVGFLFRISKINDETTKFEADFWKSNDIDGFHGDRGKAELPVARVFAAGVRNGGARPTAKASTVQERANDWRQRWMQRLRRRLTSLPTG